MTTNQIMNKFQLQTQHGCIISSNNPCIYPTKHDSYIIHVSNKLFKLNSDGSVIPLLSNENYNHGSLKSFCISLDYKKLAIISKSQSSSSSSLICTIIDLQNHLDKVICDKLPVNTTSIRFSTDSQLLGAFNQSDGRELIIYEVLTGKQAITIHFNDQIKAFAFSPSSIRRFLAVGNQVHLWRISHDYNIQQIKILGTEEIKSNLICCVWLNPNIAILGSSAGIVYLLHNNCVLNKYYEAFTLQKDAILPEIREICCKDNLVIVSSNCNIISIFKVIEIIEIGVAKDSAYSLSKIKQITLTSAHQIYTTLISSDRQGFKTTTLHQNKLNLVIATESNIGSICIKLSNHEKKEIEGEQKDNVYKSFSVEDLMNSLNTTSGFSLDEFVQTEINVEKEFDHIYMTYHTDKIINLSVSSRTSNFLSYSINGHIKIWDYTKQNILLLDKFIGCNELDRPLSVALHPYGNYFATGTSNSIIEYAITDDNVEEIRHIDMHKPFKLKDVSVVNTQPVTLLKYSHGGNLLVAVTGKVLQLFDITSLSVPTLDDSHDTSTRIMMTADHRANICDIIFTPDDQYLYTAGLDGNIYGYCSLKSSRVMEYISKRLVSNIQLCINANQSLVASFLCNNENQTIDNFLLVWMNGNLDLDPEIISTGSGVTKMSFCSDPITHIPHSYLILGYLNGDIVIADWPLCTTASTFTTSENPSNLQLNDVCIDPVVSSFRTKVVDGSEESQTIVKTHINGVNRKRLVQSVSFRNDDKKKKKLYLDLSKCTMLHIHDHEISGLQVSPSGFRIIVSSSDSCISILSTILCKDSDLPERHFPENEMILAKKSNLTAMKNEISRNEFNLLINNQECDGKLLFMAKQTGEKLIEIQKLYDDKMKTLQDTAVRELNETKNGLLSKITSLEETKAFMENRLIATDAYYQNKLFEQSQRIEQIRQAYEEMLVSSKLDHESEMKQMVGKENQLISINENMSMEIKSMKAVIRSLQESLNAEKQVANEELIIQHEVESANLKAQHAKRNDSIIAKLEAAKLEIVHLKSKVNELTFKFQRKTDEAIEAEARDKIRIETLERNLQMKAQDIQDLKSRMNESEKIISQNEKKYFTIDKMNGYLESRVKEYEQETRPKDEKLMLVVKTVDDLKHREEQLAFLISERDAQLHRLSEKVTFLQSQLTSNRHALKLKETNLSRLAKHFFNKYDEISLHLEKLHHRKNDDSELSSEIENYLNGMKDILKLYKNIETSESLCRLEELEELTAKEERKNQIEILHRSIDGLKKHLRKTSIISAMKVKQHRNHNIELLSEVDSLKNENKLVALKAEQMKNMKILKVSTSSSAISSPALHEKLNLAEVEKAKGNQHSSDSSQSMALFKPYSRQISSPKSITPGLMANSDLLEIVNTFNNKLVSSKSSIKTKRIEINSLANAVKTLNEKFDERY